MPSSAPWRSGPALRQPPDVKLTMSNFYCVNDTSIEHRLPSDTAQWRGLRGDQMADDGARLEIPGRLAAAQLEILTQPAQAFIAALARRFAPRVRELLAAREQRQARIEAGELPDFLPQTRAIRDADWRVAAIPPDLLDRRVEITGPTERKMIINALNSGARVFMADCEDSLSPGWDNVVGGQLNLRDAVRRTIGFTSPEGRQYRLNDSTAVLMVRPRGWHLYEKHILLDGFGRHFDWPREWTPGRPFDNVHLLRNPIYKAKQILDYSSDGLELGFKAGQSDRIERSRKEFMASEVVKTHVADPLAVWREAFLINDGGMSYLAQSIAAVCDNRVKYRQIVAALDDLRHSMQDRLRRYYVSENYAFQQDRRHTSGLLVVRRLRSSAESHNFGYLLRSLQLSESQFGDVMRNVEVWTGARFDPAEEEEFADDDLFDEFHDTGRGKSARKDRGKANGHGVAHANGDKNGSHHAEAETAPELVPTARLCARTAVDHWIESVRAIATGESATTRYQLPRQALLHLVDELIVGAERGDQFVVNDFHDHLARRHRFDDGGADRLLAHPVGEGANHFERDVGLKQGAADFAHGGIDVGLRERAAPRQTVEYAPKSFRQIVEHRGLTCCSRRR